MNLNLLRMGVQGLEMQKAALLAMRAAADAGKPGAASAAAGAPELNPMLWPWAAMQQAMMAGAPQPAQAAPAGNEKKRE